MCIFASDMIDMTNLFNQLLEQTGSVDMAERDFKRMIYDDSALRKQYRAWCSENGYTERNGFLEYCREYINRQDDIWGVFMNDDNEGL